MSNCTFPTCACDVPATCSRITPFPTTTTKATMTTETTTIDTLTLADLPALNAPLADGSFAGITTRKDGTHCAVVRLPASKVKENLTWKQAMAWAKEQGGELPTRSPAAMLFENSKEHLAPEAHWTADEYGASYAWYCGFRTGGQHYGLKGYSLAAVAVRLIPLTA